MCDRIAYTDDPTDDPTSRGVVVGISITGKVTWSSGGYIRTAYPEAVSHVPAGPTPTEVEGLRRRAAAGQKSAQAKLASMGVK